MVYDGNLFVERLKEIAKVKKQSELAKIINIDETRISRWITAKNYPQVETLIDISQKLNCSIDSLIGSPDQDTRKDIFDVIKNFMILDMYGEIPFDFNYETIIQREKGEIIGHMDISQDDETDYWFLVLCEEYMNIRKSFEFISNKKIKLSMINELINEYKNSFLG